MRVKCYIMAALVGMTAMIGCSVKTDRSECPGLLYMSVYGGDEDIMYANVIGGDYEHLMRISKREGVGVAAFELPKYEVFNVMFFSGSPMSWDGTIDMGEQMPQLYAANREIICESDVTELKLKLEKQYCRLNVMVVGLDCRVRIRGDVMGLDMNDLTPLPGLFCVEQSPIIDIHRKSQHFVFDVPRQIDDSLMLEMVVESSGLSPVYTYDLGKRLMESGVDWNKPSLDDVYVNIEYMDNKFVFEIQNWDKIEL